jgi:hypothetical protein
MSPSAATPPSRRWRAASIIAEDPLQPRITRQQPGERFQRYCSVLIAEMEEALGY